MAARPDAAAGGRAHGFTGKLQADGRGGNPEPSTLANEVEPKGNAPPAGLLPPVAGHPAGDLGRTRRIESTEFRAGLQAGHQEPEKEGRQPDAGAPIEGDGERHSHDEDTDGGRPELSPGMNRDQEDEGRQGRRSDRWLHIL